MTAAPRPRLLDAVLAADAITEIPAPEYVVGGILQADSLAAVYGPPGSGKSFLALDVALSVASDRPWRGLPVMSGPVLYIVAEDLPGTAQRVRAWRRRYGELGGISWLPQPVQLLAPGTVEQLIEVAATVAPALIVIDTLARCIPGLDENSAQEMGRLVQVLDQIRHATGACVLLVHHSGKDGSRGMRGSTALLGAVDTTVECSRTLSGITATVRKAKNAPDGQAMRFRLDPEGDSAVLVDDGSADSPDGWRPTILMGRISDFLADQDRPVSQYTVFQAVPGKRTGKFEAIHRLVQEGYVAADSGARNSTLLRLLKPFTDSPE